MNVWTAHGPYGGSVHALAINPTTPSTLYAGTYGSGVYRTTDSGGRWTAVNTGLSDLDVHALAINKTTPSTLYAGTYGGGVFRSTDSGGGWTAVNTGLDGSGVCALAIDKTTPSTLYAGTHWGTFRSTDSGDTWRPVNSGLGLRFPPPEINALAIDPTTPSTLYAGTFNFGVFKSTDSGGSWSALNTDLTNTYVSALAIDPRTPSTLYAGTGAGVFDLEQVSSVPTCTGDCDGSGDVTVNELITLVSIALGTAQPSACQHGIPSGGEVTISLIIQAVNNALDGCGG
jgi:hypothetical protein